MLEALQTARSLAQAGNVAAAIDTLEALDAAGAADADTLFLLGALLRETHEFARAVPVLERLAAARPDLTPALAELALALAVTGQPGRAVDLLREVHRRVPGHSTNAVLAELLVSYGRKLVLEGRYAESLPYLDEAAAVNHTVPGALNTLAVARSHTGDLPGGLELVGHALAYYPNDIDALCNQSYMLDMLGRPEEAEAVARQVVEQLAPDLGGAWTNLANALHSQGRLEEAQAATEKALSLEPDLAPALANMGSYLSVRGELDHSAAFYRAAIERAPGNPALPFLLACDRLRAGEWEEGWTLYEQRDRHPFDRISWPGIEPLPRWQGGDPAGLRILLECEQGHGDSLQFFRYARLLADRGAQVGILTHQATMRLFQQSDPRLTVVEQGWKADPAHWDYGLPLLSAPRLFGTRPDNVPNAPYLTADPADKAAWVERLAGLRDLKVGLVWAGDARVHNPRASSIDRRRSIALSALAPLGTVPGVEFVSLQKGGPAAQLAGAPFPVHDWMDEVRDFADTAALVSQLDLVVTVDTSVAHLAGGLGVPVMMLSRYDGCWRWMHGRDDTPWYPRMRLFRQRRWADWSDPVAELRDALVALAAG